MPADLTVNLVPRRFHVTTIWLPSPVLPTRTDGYGHARLPASAHSPEPHRVEKIPYGRFRNVYLYITERCQLRCEHCYMGERLDRALKMPLDQVAQTLRTWRLMGGSKLTILGGEPTLHPDYVQIVGMANDLGYEHVITTSNGLEPAIRKFRGMAPTDFAYIQISLDGGSPGSHDRVRGAGTFGEAVRNVDELVRLGFDTRIICTVNRVNAADSLRLLDIAEQLGVSLVKYHVFSVIGSGHGAADWAMRPEEWIDFYERLEQVAAGRRTRVWYQPTYARRERIGHYAAQGYRGCIGRTLDRISIFPDGRAYVCSYLFDTDLNFATMVDGKIALNHGSNEFDLFTKVLAEASCGSCKASSSCLGGCPAEELVMGTSSCAADPEIVPVCRLWKADVPTTVPA
jgi:radical SAM protein with 4Fe4S-binding SPASM domain